MNPKGLVLALLVSCAPARPPLPTEATPGIVFPHHIAEGRGGGGPPGSRSPSKPRPLPPAPSATPSPSGAAPAVPAASRPSHPDPEPLRTPKQYELRLVHEDGRVTVEAVRPLTFRQPVVTVRNMGRFALELWIGQELIDRVRFDFPLLGVEAPKATGRKPLDKPPAFGGKLAVTVLVPASPRVRRALVLDRATGKETDLSWPPTVTAVPAASGTVTAVPAAPGTVTAPPAAPAAPTPSSVVPSAAPSEPARPR
jgi:hypothetical protein